MGKELGKEGKSSERRDRRKEGKRIFALGQKKERGASLRGVKKKRRSHQKKEGQRESFDGLWEKKEKKVVMLSSERSYRRTNGREKKKISRRRWSSEGGYLEGKREVLSRRKGREKKNPFLTVLEGKKRVRFASELASRGMAG